jgi:hypothetical protein
MRHAILVRHVISIQALRDLLREKLAPCGRGAVLFTDIAAAAERAGRRRLATMLLDYEPRAADQVCPSHRS